MLEAAAVAGMEMDAGLLASVIHQGQLGDLVAVGLLEREEDRFRFRHPLLQEAAYDEVPAERRRTLHEQIAAAMAKTDSHSAERVAHHLERADRPEAALSVLDTAASCARLAGGSALRLDHAPRTSGSSSDHRPTPNKPRIASSSRRAR